jgi:hypothetical protein
MSELEVRTDLEPMDAEGRVLTTKARKQLPASSFVFPKDRRYPIHDRAHAANALARSKGKPEEAKVRAAVCKKYPSLPACQKKRTSKQN